MLARLSLHGHIPLQAQVVHVPDCDLDLGRIRANCKESE